MGADLRACVFGLGAFCAASQACLFRELLAVFNGTEILIGSALAAWMVSAPAGTAAAVKLTRFLGSRAALALLGALGPVSVVLGIVVLRQFGQGWSPAAVLFFFGIPGACIAGSLAAAFDLNSHGDEGRRSSWVLSLDSFGSFAGGALLSAMFVSGVRTFTACAFFSSAAFALSLLCFIKGRFRKKVFIFIFIVSAAALAPFVRRIDAGTALARYHSRGLPGERIREIETRYQTFSLAKDRESFHVFFNGRYGFTYPDLAVWAPLMALVVSQNDPDAVLFAGAAGGNLVRHAAGRPGRSIDWVEQDAGVFSFVEFMDSPLLKVPQVNLIKGDARRHIQQTRKIYDAIIIGTAAPCTLSENRYFTMEFFMECRKRLSEKGVLAFTLPGSQNYMSRSQASYLGSVYAALKAVFLKVLAVPADGMIMIASNYAFLSDDPSELSRRFENGNMRIEGFVPRLFGLLLDKGRMSSVKYMFSEYGIPNTDSRPSNVLYHTLWKGASLGVKTAPAMESAVEFFKKRKAPLAFFIGLFIFCASIFLKRRTERYIMCTTGFVNMGCVISLMMMFQCACGYLFESSALLAGVFMLGLGSGGLLSQVFRGPKTLEYCEMAFCLLFAASAVLIYERGLPQNPHFYWLFLAFSGIIGGIEFPEAVRRLGGPRSFSAVYYFEMLGAAAGAAAASWIIIPLYGCHVLFVLCAFIKAAPLVVTAVQRLLKRT